MAKMPSFRRLVEKSNFAPHQSAVGVDTFPRLNLDVVARDLELEQHGRVRGAEEEPPVDATHFDEVEERVLAYVAGRREDALKIFRQRFDDYTNGLHGLGLQTAVTTIEGASRQGCAEIDAKVASAERSVSRLDAALARADDDLVRFRAANGRDMEPSYPASLGAWVLRIGVLLALLLVESFLNAVFLGEGSEYGLAGGWLEAIAITAVNVAAGVTAGIAPFRMANHVAPATRNLGRALAAGWFVLFALGFNLLAGHYRDALAVGADDAGGIALRSFLAAPFELATAQSWMLLVIGIGCSMLAAFDGYKMSDPYPGYAAKAKTATLARHDRDVEVDRLVGEVTGRYAAALREMKDVEGRIARNVVHSEQHKLSISSLHESFAHHLKYLEGCAVSLLAIYRDANKAARPKGTTPRSFRRKPVLATPPGLPTLPAEYTTENLSRLSADAESRRKRGEARLEAARRKALEMGRVRGDQGTIDDGAGGGGGLRLVDAA